MSMQSKQIPALQDRIKETKKAVRKAKTKKMFFYLMALSITVCLGYLFRDNVFMSQKIIESIVEQIVSGVSPELYPTFKN